MKTLLAMFIFAVLPLAACAEVQLGEQCRALDDSTSSERRRLYNASLYANPSWGSAQGHVRSFLLSGFDPLEAQYLVLGTLYPREVGIWWDYLKSNPPLLDGNGWRLLFGEVTDRAFSVQNPDNCSYQLLDEHGVNILTQAVSANVHPALTSAARDGIARSFLVYSTPELGGPGGGQAEFVRQEQARWGDILSPRP